MRYSEIVTKSKTKQTEQMWNEPEQKLNNAGGYVYSTDDETQLERFLLLGSEGGTYYVGQSKLTKDNGTNVLRLIKTNGVKVANTAIDFLKNNRAPKADASLFTLAMCVSYGDAETKAVVYNFIPSIGYTTRLFMFIANVVDMRGWSSGLRKAVAKWYTNKTTDQLGYQIIKYRNREGFTHKDLIRLSHPKQTSKEQNELFKFILGKEGIDSDLLPSQVVAYATAMSTNDVELVVKLINEFGLTHEMIPNTMLDDKNVLEALLGNMENTALLRNLNRFAIAGLTNSNTSKITKTIVEKINNVRNVHPINVLNTLNTYNSGRGFKGSNTWTPNKTISAALHDLFNKSFESISTINKDLLVAVDVSGSMSMANIANMSMNAAQAATAMTLAMVKNEQFIDTLSFDTQARPTKINKNMSFDDLIKQFPNGGGTDCSAPIRWAINSKNKYDAIIIFTDSETWAGKSHAVEELKLYRKINKDVKIIEVAMTATNNTLFNMKEPNVLRIVGFDSSIPELINKFVNSK